MPLSRFGTATESATNKLVLKFLKELHMSQHVFV